MLIFAAYAAMLCLRHTPLSLMPALIMLRYFRAVTSRHVDLPCRCLMRRHFTDAAMLLPFRFLTLFLLLRQHTRRFTQSRLLPPAAALICYGDMMFADADMLSLLFSHLLRAMIFDAADDAAMLLLLRAA